MGEQGAGEKAQKARRKKTIVGAVVVAGVSIVVGYFIGLVSTLQVLFPREDFKEWIVDADLLTYRPLLAALEEEDMEEIKDLVYLRMMTDIGKAEAQLELDDTIDKGNTRRMLRMIALDMHEHPFRMSDAEMNSDKDRWVQEQMALPVSEARTYEE